MTITVPCPAKINEFLSVGPIDANGYHPISTIFQAVGLYDLLTVSDESGTDFFGSDVDLPERNTVTRTWDMVRECVKLPPLTVFLRKSIPSQAGLGGGSSDAAAFLRAVRAFVPEAMGDKDLLEIAAAVGADVPFFLVGGRAKGTGYGDILSELPDEKKRWVLLAKPSVASSTPEMYAALDSFSPGPDGPRDLAPGENDFEKVSPSECLSLIRFMRNSPAEYAGLSGSGSAVFGIFRTLVGAWETELHLRSIPDGLWTAVVPTLSRSASLRSGA